MWRMDSDKDVARAPVLFNLYTCLAVERWLIRMEGVGGVGVTVRFKYDAKLMRRYTNNACERRITECQFADDSALLVSTRSGTEHTPVGYHQTSRDFGLTVSLLKTKQAERWMKVTRSMWF